MLKTFSLGGIHPPENKLSVRKAIKDMPLPDTVTIPISQHIGAPAKILVKRGDEVKVGQLIAQSGGIYFSKYSRYRFWKGGKDRPSYRCKWLS